MPIQIGNFFFGLVLLAFALTKNANLYWWFAYFMLLFAEPGYLFASSGSFKLPSINISALGREIFYNEVFTIIVLIKSLLNWRKIKIYYYLPISLILIYSYVLIIQGLFMGLNLLGVLKTLRFQMPMFLMLVIPSIMKHDKVFPFIRLLFISVFILFIAQLVDILTGSPPYRILS